MLKLNSIVILHHHLALSDRCLSTETSDKSLLRQQESFSDRLVIINTFDVGMLTAHNPTTNVYVLIRLTDADFRVFVSRTIEIGLI
jgi:hypothetical protein